MNTGTQTPRTDKAMHGHPKYQNTITVAFARQLETELNAANQRILDLEETLAPFALYASALDGRDGLDTVAKNGVQSITVGSFRMAKEAMPPRE